MVKYDLFEHLRIHFFGLIWLLMSANDVCATVCSDKYSGSSPVVSMCFGGIATGRVVVLDAQTATINDTECACFLTVKGSISLMVNAAQQPGYAGCGSKIDVSFSSPRELFIFNCFASSFNQMDNGSTANFTLLKSTSASLWNYCLVLQVSSSDQSDSIKMVCSGPAIGQATSSTLETTVATALTSKVTTIGTMSTSSPLLSTTKTNEQLRTNYISSTVRENLTTEGITETNLSNSTTHKPSTTVTSTRTLTIPSISSSANMTNPTSPHIDLFPSTEEETPPPSALSTTLEYISTMNDTIVTMNVTTSTTVLSPKQTQTSSGTTASTLTMPSATSSANMTNSTMPHIDSLPSTEKETSPPLELSTTPKNISTTTKETILTEEVTTTTTDISSNQTQTKIQLTSPVSSTPNVAASETTTITSNTPHLKTEPTTDISLSRLTIPPVSDSSAVTTSVIATPTRTSTSSFFNSTLSTMEMTHTSVTTNTITQTNITSSLKHTVRTTERTLPLTRFSTTLRSTTAQTSTATEPTTSIAKTVTQNPSPSSPSSSSSSSLSPPSSPSSSSSSSSITSTSTSLSSSLLSSSKATALPATTNTTSTFTTTQSTQFLNTTMYATSSLPPSTSSTSSSSQSTTRRATTTTSESTAKVSEGIKGRNVTTSPLEKKEIELLPVLLPSALAGAIIIAFVLFLTFTMVIRHRRTKSYHTGHDGEYHKPIYAETIKDKEVVSSFIGYDNFIYTENKELQSPSNGTEMSPIQNIYGEKALNTADHFATSFVSDNHF